MEASFSIMITFNYVLSQLQNGNITCEVNHLENITNTLFV